MSTEPEPPTNPQVVPGPYFVVAAQVVSVPDGPQISDPDFCPELETLLSLTKEVLSCLSDNLPIEGNPFPFEDRTTYANEMAFCEATLALRRLQSHLQTKFGSVGFPDVENIQWPQLSLRTNVALARLRTTTKAMQGWFDSRRPTEERLPRLPHGFLEQLARAANLLKKAIRRERRKMCLEKPDDPAGAAVASEKGQSSQSAPRLQDIGLAIEHSKKWVAFRQSGGRWSERSRVRISQGIETKLLFAFVEGKGYLSKIDAIKLVLPKPTGQDAVRIWTMTIKPAMSRLKKKIRQAVGLPRKADPLPWQKDSRGWRAAIRIGIAEQLDSEYAGVENRLKFTPTNP